MSDALHALDDFLRELWQTVESLPAYRGRTTLILTTDASLLSEWERVQAEQVAAALDMAAVAAGLGVELEESATGGGSDGNFTGALGVPTLDGLGGVGEGAHAENESILVDRIVDRVKRSMNG